jgi:hypothetical protein
MAVSKIECPECHTILKPAKPLAPGKKIRCPKCDHVITVPGEPAEETVPKGAVRKAEDAAVPSSPAGPKKTVPAPAKPRPAQVDDDDDDGGTYAVLRDPGEEDDDDDKPKINYAPDLTVTDPRGPATAALALPSNWIMLLGALIVVGCIGAIGVFTWPFMFTDHGTAVTPLDARKQYAQEHPPKSQGPAVEARVKKDDDAPEPEVKYDDLKPEEKAKFEEMKDEDQMERGLWAGGLFLLMIFGGVMTFSSVKMTNLESYRWSMACSIMAMVSIIAAPFGIIALTQLKLDEIKEAFDYKQE